MRIPKTSIRTTWRADWLAEFSIALVVLAFLTREVTFAAVGAGILSALASLGLIFHRKVGILRREIHVVQHLSKTRVLLGDSVEGELTIRNGSREAAQVLTVQPALEETLSFRLSSSFDRLLRPGTTSSLKFVISTLSTGRLQISGFMLIFTDARELFSSEVEYAQTGSVVEVGRGVRTQAPPTPLRLYGGGPEILRKAPTGTDYAGIREYAAGDEYHRVEWKATARLRKLMVKEFHPETQTTLQILIDAGRTMHQQSYVGTKLDEALAVASLLAESAVGSAKSICIWIYGDTEIIRVLKPATPQEQLVRLRGLMLVPKVMSRGPAQRVQPRQTLREIAPDPHRTGRVDAFIQMLKLRRSLDYRKAGFHSALAESTKTDLDSLLVLTDLQTQTDALLRAVSTHRDRSHIIIAQIGAPWRLTYNLEEAYAKYQINSRTLKRFSDLDVAVFDLRPERLVETIAQRVSKAIMARSRESIAARVRKP